MTFAVIGDPRVILWVRPDLFQQGRGFILRTMSVRKEGENKEKPPSVLQGTRPKQHRLPEAEMFAGASPSSSSSGQQQLEGRKETSCQEFQLSKGPQNLAIVMYGVFSFS